MDKDDDPALPVVTATTTTTTRGHRSSKTIRTTPRSFGRVVARVGTGLLLLLLMVEGAVVIPEKEDEEGALLWSDPATAAEEGTARTPRRHRRNLVTKKNPQQVPPTEYDVAFVDVDVDVVDVDVVDVDVDVAVAPYRSPRDLPDAFQQRLQNLPVCDKENGWGIFYAHPNILQTAPMKNEFASQPEWAWARLMALINDNVSYGKSHELPAGWAKVEAAPFGADLQPKEYGHMHLYEYAAKKTLIVAVRGADGSWEDDQDCINLSGQLPIGKKPYRFFEADRVTAYFAQGAGQEKYKGWTNYLTGHSLGGAVVLYMATNTGGNPDLWNGGHAFDPYSYKLAATVGFQFFPPRAANKLSAVDVAEIMESRERIVVHEYIADKVGLYNPRGARFNWSHDAGQRAPENVGVVELAIAAGQSDHFMDNFTTNSGRWPFPPFGNLFAQI